MVIALESRRSQSETQRRIETGPATPTVQCWLCIELAYSSDLPRFGTAVFCAGHGRCDIARPAHNSVSVADGIFSGTGLAPFARLDFDLAAGWQTADGMG